MTHSECWCTSDWARGEIKGLASLGPQLSFTHRAVEKGFIPETDLPSKYAFSEPHWIAFVTLAVSGRRAI